MLGFNFDLEAVEVAEFQAGVSGGTLENDSDGPVAIVHPRNFGKVGSGVGPVDQVG